MKNDIIRKLCSRKFILAVISFVTGLMIYFGKTAEQAEQVAALIMAGASVIAYIVGEGLIDAAGAGNPLNTIAGWEEDKPPEEDPQE